MFPMTPLPPAGQPGGGGLLSGQNAEVSNHGPLFGPGPIAPRTENGPTWLGVCRVPGALSEVPLALKSSGLPLIIVITVLTCQPPATQFAQPECNRGLPLPNGNS